MLNTASVNEVHKSNVGKAILSGNEVVVVRHKLVTVDNKKLKLNSLYCFCNWIRERYTNRRSFIH